MLTSSMRSKREEGFVLPTVMGLGAIVLILSTTAVILGSVKQRNSATALRISLAQYAAEIGLEQAQYVLWGKVWKGLTPGTRAAYASRLEQTNYEGGNLKKCNPCVDVHYPTATTTYPLIYNNLAYTFTIKRRVNSVANDLNIAFDITSTGTLPNGTVRVLKQVFQVKPQSFGGLDYAVLSNNINCIFCHIKVLDMKALGGVATAGSPTNRVKVGTLEKLRIERNFGFALRTRLT